MATITVQMAVFGAQPSTNQNQAANVTAALQKAINASSTGLVQITDTTMGTDPSYGNLKSFGAVVTVNGVPQYFACQENQEVNFYPSTSPA
jgi:hypothetical protein